MKTIVAVIAIAGAVILLSRPVLAEDRGHGMKKFGCPMANKSHEGQCPVEGKLMKKAGFLLEHEQELGLTADQTKTIRELKLNAEKERIQQESGQKIFMIDLMAKLKEDKIDSEGANALIDKNFSSMAAALKSNVDAYAKLKSVLTPDQLLKMKEIKKDKEEKDEERGERKERRTKREEGREKHEEKN